jgi:hypothetical protein
MKAAFQTKRKTSTRAHSTFTPVPQAVLQRKCASHPPSSVSKVPPIVHDVLNSPGQPLDSSTRALMELHFGHDFGHVRVHVDSQAAKSASVVDALAFTVADHVVFGARQYEPETLKGRRLVAHELTHVIQQPRVSVPPSLSVGAVDDTHEYLANESASNLSSRSNVATPSRASVHLQRQPVGREDDPKGKPHANKKTYGPFLLPEVVISATRSYPLSVAGGFQASSNLEKLGVRSVTFVKVETVEDLEQRKWTLNQQAEDQLRENVVLSQGTLKDGSPGAEQRTADTKTKQILHEQFGDFWGTFFWWTRGGGQTGEGSPIWEVLKAGSVLNPSNPVRAFPSQKPVYRPDRLPYIPQTEWPKGR